MALGAAEFDFIRRLVLDQSAIVLDADKTYLVESRLLPLARREGLDSIGGLVGRLRGAPFNGLHQEVVEAMTTNETSFFRDFHPFEMLRKGVLPELLARRADERRLNIWCAACSAGQEPYSVGMVLREHFPQLANWNVRILASDISREMVERAREGRYSQLEVNRGLPASLLVKYFQKQGCEWQIQPSIRGMVDFTLFNLAAAWPPLPPMDIILMRNVLIYFSVETKKNILAKIRRQLKPDGFLLLGGAETTFNLDESYQRVQFDRGACYRVQAA